MVQQELVNSPQLHQQANPFMLPEQMQRSILEVTEVRLTILKSQPQQLQIIASGIVPSTGWLKPQLLPYTYVEAYSDSIYDFEFVATLPRGTETQAMTSIVVKTILLAEGVRGIRVHTAANTKEVFLSETVSSCQTTEV